MDHDDDFENIFVNKMSKEQCKCNLKKGIKSVTVYRYLLLNWFPWLAVDGPTLWIGAETLHSIHRQSLVLRSIYTEYLSSYIRLIIFEAHFLCVCVFFSISYFNFFYYIWFSYLLLRRTKFFFAQKWMIGCCEVLAKLIGFFFSKGKINWRQTIY